MRMSCLLMGHETGMDLDHPLEGCLNGWSQVHRCCGISQEGVPSKNEGV